MLDSGRMKRTERTLANQDGMAAETATISDLEAEHEASTAHLKSDDAELKSLGFTHRVDAWIHPASGGDDHSITLYGRGKATHGRIAEIIRSHGSAVDWDYSVTVL